MGKAKSYEIIEYRKKIMNEIVKSENMIKLFGEDDAEYPEQVIPYQYAFPYKYIPDTVKETDRFCNFDISVSLDTSNRFYRDISIYFFVFCHKESVQYTENGEKYLWYDKVVCELDDLFTDTNVLGVGKTWLLTNDPYYPQDRFIGRQVRFVVKDFTNGLKYGK